MNTDWSDHVQGVDTLYLSRKLRFDDRFSAAYRGLLRLEGARRILEVGCGPGALAGALARWYPGASVTGLDRDAAFIAFARAHEPGAAFVEGDATALPFPDGSFDATVSYTVSEHVEPDAFFGEQYRVLRPGGVCLVLSARRGPRIGAACLAPDDFERAFWEKAAPLDDSREKYAVGRHAMSEAQLPEAMARRGFTAVNTGYAVSDLTPDDPKYPRAMALAMIEAERRGELENVAAARRDLAAHFAPEDFDEMTRRVNRRYDARTALYLRGEKQWDTNVSLTLAVRGEKPEGRRGA